MISNRETQTVYAGKVAIGGGHPVTVQSMLNIPASDVEGNVAQACRLEAADEPGMADTLPAEPASEFPGDFYQDPHVGEVFRFKELLAGMDSLDLDILRELLRGARYFDMTESLHTTENTIKYRIKRMTAAMGLKSRAELLKLAGEYLAEEKNTNGMAL